MDLTLRWMENITFVKSLKFGSKGLYVENEKGQTSSVFIRQGSLDYASMTYSVIMMLILLGFFIMEDLHDPGCRDDDSFIAKLKKNYLEGLKGLSKYEYTLSTFSNKLAKIGAGILNVEAFTTIKGQFGDLVSYDKLHELIEKTLSGGAPVQIVYFNLQIQRVRSVAAIGYSVSANVLRLYCLDPALPLPYCSYWNHIIDIHLQKDARYDMYVDWSYGNDCEIIVDGILLVS